MVSSQSDTSSSTKSMSDELRAADTRHRQVIQRTNIWKEKILPKWNEHRGSRKVRDLCYQGIPPSLRGRVWCLLIGNERKVSEEYFKQLVAVADGLYEEAADRELCLDSQYKQEVALQAEEQRRERLQSIDALINTSGLHDVDDENEDDDEDEDEEEDAQNDEKTGGASHQKCHLGLRASITDPSDTESVDGVLDEGFFCEDDFNGKFDYAKFEDGICISSEGDALIDKDEGAEDEEGSDDEEDILHRAALFDITDNDIKQTDLRQISELQNGVSDVKTHLLGIERDIPRTFPTLAFFHDGGPLEMSLRRILRAFVCGYIF